MNEIIKTILARQSVRSYEAKQVPMADVETILACGKYAATAMGLQPWHFTVVRSREKLDMITAENKRIIMASGNQQAMTNASAPDFDNFRGAPMAIIVSGDSALASSRGDAANAVENMAVAATALGIASLYIGSFAPAFERENAQSLKETFGIPAGYQPYYALALGYRKGAPEERKPRREGTVNYID